MISPEKKKNYHLTEKFGAKFYDVTPRSWDEAKEIGKILDTHVFRGQSDNKWPLSTTLERAAKRFDCPPEKLWEREKYILRVFKSRAHHFLNSPPDKDEILEWLSIIQDFGGPTRLLDFTESFYIASYFALDSAVSEASVWAIDNISLRIMPHLISAIGEERIGLENDKEYEDNPEEILRYAEAFVLDSSKDYDLVLRVTPPRLNERLATQKGLFLFSCNLKESFENNLCKTFGFPFNTLISSNAVNTNLLEDIKGLKNSKRLDQLVSVVKINLTKDLHKSAIKDLHSMNVDAASLFPGLDGFARSLNFSLQFPPQSYSAVVTVHKSPSADSMNTDSSPVE